MEKIGSGFQYNVYSAGDKVRKVPKSRLNLYNSLKFWHTSQRGLLSALRGDERRKAAIRGLKSRDIPLEDLFRIESFEGQEVIQKRLIPVDEILSSSEKNFEEVAEDYFELLHELWSYGIGDTVYNFTVNCGYDGEELVMMDFGEVTFSKEKVLEAVRDEKWKSQWSYTTDLTDKERKIFRSKAEKNFTVEKVEKLWKSKI